jgi:hypothetical protein
MTENQKFLLFMAVWLSSVALTAYWIIWKIKRDADE